MLEYAHGESRYFEKPYGTFNPRMVRYWDDLFLLCLRHGIRILLTPFDTYWMLRRWRHHPYNAKHGGPARTSKDFFTHEMVIEAMIRRFRFIIERWGEDGTLAAWDLFNEIRPCWGGTPQQQGAVLSRISEAVREIERERWGFTRPQTVSMVGPNPSPEYEAILYRHPALDFSSPHFYGTRAMDLPRDTAAPARAMGRWMRHAWSRMDSPRPLLNSEHGPVLACRRRNRLPETLDDEYERHLMWVHLASGGAGSGMRWPYRQPHLLTPGMRRSLRSMAGFMTLVDWRRFSPEDAMPEVKVGATGIEVFACRDRTQAVIWLMRRAPPKHTGPLPVSEPICPLVITLSGMEPGKYVARLWRTKEGGCMGSLPAPWTGGKLRITVPRFENDIALALTSAREACFHGDASLKRALPDSSTNRSLSLPLEF
ncbi:MAG: hypothetical protein KY468_19800 [Armatimonadetes bacterium]|nr:hypothetical protein [Armatimonadota bacterium]